MFSILFHRSCHFVISPLILTPLHRKWLQEALSAISDTPSETDLLKASLAVLKAHRIPAESGSLSQDEKQALLTAANDTLYFIEDLDHANGKWGVTVCAVCGLQWLLCAVFLCAAIGLRNFEFVYTNILIYSFCIY